MSSSNELSLSQTYLQSSLNHPGFTETIDHFSCCNDIWIPRFTDAKVTPIRFYIRPNVGGFLSLTIQPEFDLWTDVKIKVSLIDFHGEKKLFYNKFHEAFGKSLNSDIQLPTFISRADLLEPSNGYLPGNKLTLHYEFAFLEKKQNTLKEVTGPSKGETTQKAMKDYDRLLKKGTFADVKLIVGGKTIRAHRLILAARSSVFAAMFAHDTLEKQESQVEISDVAPETFETLLKFLYTCKVPTLENIQSAQELLLVADKYDAAQLKTFCEVYLINELTIETAPSLLLFANSANTPKLKERALEFIGSRCSAFVDALKSDPDQLINLFQYLAKKDAEKEEKEKSK